MAPKRPQTTNTDANHKRYVSKLITAVEDLAMVGGVRAKKRRYAKIIDPILRKMCWILPGLDLFISIPTLFHSRYDLDLSDDNKEENEEREKEGEEESSEDNAEPRVKASSDEMWKQVMALCPGLEKALDHMASVNPYALSTLINQIKLSAWGA
ncbi:hypothetical protein EST38_g11123 [Candolleomyces aberdarensis]|uniref:Uncharacterized protein n=1 Tax=Candolleomyces aberdarensis TaxID=2316362 RepID=A0A4Q2D7Y6_9AGAR|nr:hypothetical protein EST38_g11123 [Candolleomyces aberdarensis]